MRTPRQLEIKDLCRRSIEPLMEKHRLGPVKKIVMDEAGWVNPCFFVNDLFVIRFNARDPSLPKYQREKSAFDLLRSTGVPVPAKVLLDESKISAPFDVLITELIPGRNLESDWAVLDSCQRKTLARDAGEKLVKMSVVELPFFGELGSTGPLPRASNWIDYLDAKLSLHLKEADGLSIFDPQTIEKFWAVFRHCEPALSEVVRARLVHVDYHFGNLLYVGDKVTGVVDFEWAFAGDPLYDYCRWSQETEEWPESRAAFLEGCGRKSFSGSELERLKFYQMLRNIELCIVAKLHFDSAEAESFKDATLLQVGEL